MRVLHVLNGPAGGAANSTVEIAQEMRTRGVAAAALCHDVGSEASKGQLVEQFPGPVEFQSMYLWNRRMLHPTWQRMAVSLRQITATRFSVSSAVRIAKFSRAHGCTLIHSNTLLTPDGAMAALMLGSPHVWHARETVGVGAMQRFFGEREAFIRTVKGTSSVLVANSDFTARSLACLDDELPLRVVRNAVDVSPFSAIPLLAPNAERRIYNVGMVGTVGAAWKRHDLFLEVAALLRNDSRFRFTVYGALPNRNSSAWAHYMALKQRVLELGLKSRLDFETRFQRPADVMENLDILVQPTAIESFGRVVVEAMAAGRPVVAVREGAAPEILMDGQEGLLARSDPIEIAEAVRKVVDDPPATTRRVELARKRAFEDFSVVRLGDELQEVYEDALAFPLQAQGLWSSFCTVHLHRLWRSFVGTRSVAGGSD